MTLDLNRRGFMKSVAAAGALGTTTSAWISTIPTNLVAAARPKKPAVIRGAFFYPPADVVLEGKCEDNWAQHQWSTWPGNQFEPEHQQAKFLAHVREIAAELNLDIRIDKQSLYTDAAIAAFIDNVKATQPDALLLFDFWNSFKNKLVPILEAFEGPIILYHPVGANHQLPPEAFRTAKRVQYIHSIEHWPALERGLRAVHAKVQLAQSRLLRVSGKVEAESEEQEVFFGMPVHTVPAAQFNDLFDSTDATDALRDMADAVRAGADRITDLEDQAFIDAVRAHATVQALMERHNADAITIECLFLKHRKPCLSFAVNNGGLVPCGCENDLNATLTLMLGAAMFGRGGFQHNPEFDLEENLYFGSHCTCLTKLHGPNNGDALYSLRPFFHQLPKSLALDVIWPAGERVTLCKYHSGENSLDAWAGELVSSPTCPPAGGCATRVLVKMDGVSDICSIYPGPHPVMYCGDYARQVKTFAKLYNLALKTNV